MFPLDKVTKDDLRMLCKTLWSWQACQQCGSGDACETNQCPASRERRLNRFFQFYTDLTRSYAPDVDPGEQPALRSHQDLFEVIEMLKQEPGLTRELLSSKMFDQRTTSDREQGKAINLVVKVFAMITCVEGTHSTELLESGPDQVAWQHGVAFSQFIEDVFPTSDHPSLNGASGLTVEMRRALRATKLKKRARLSFHGTDDIRRHLQLNHKTGKVAVFHHTAFLKEQLRLTKDLTSNTSVVESLRLGALPRQLVLEVIESIQDLLFPLTDPKSLALLQSLTSKKSGFFDPDCLRFDFSSIRRVDENFVSYYYFGGRLLDLYSELENPRPRGGLARWLERRSQARYVMLATLVGVLIAVLLGLAALAVTIFQTWITYQSWKHPVQK